MVQLGVNSDILDAHCLLGKLFNLLDGLGCLLLEGNVVHPLVQMNRVFTLREAGVRDRG